MNEIISFIGLGVFLCTALGLACYPLRKHRGLIIMLAPMLLLFVTSIYWFWGGGLVFHEHFVAERNQQRVKDVLASMRSPDELIDKLKVRVQQQPSNPKGWYILGRVYASQGKWKEAMSAFAAAIKLDPQDEKIQVNYAQAVWQSNQQKFDETVRGLFVEILKNNPNQADSLAMLAMDAFMRHDYSTSIDYWQHLLKLVPQDSNDAQTIRKAIAKAQQNLQGEQLAETRE